MTIRFDNRVAIVTGAGGGLGRSHALALAARGARVVVNDLGGTLDGTGTGVGQAGGAARRVVEEIVAAGGTAVADSHSVADSDGAAALVETAVSRYGRLDIVVNNAGILRDKSFGKMDPGDFASVVDVHLLGSAHVTRAAWPYLQAARYGRVVMTTSAAGLYGNFGQANYGAAKLGLVGLMNTLKIEGQKSDIRVNTIAPVAATRMTETILPPAILERLQPAPVTAAVLFLVSDDAPNGAILAAGAGYFAKVEIVEAAGIQLGDQASCDDVARHWPQIADMAGAAPFNSAMEALTRVITAPPAGAAS